MDKNDSKSSLSGNSKGVIAPHDPFETSVLKLPLYVATSRINSDTIHVNASLNSYISTVRQRNEFLNMIVSRVRQLEGVFVPTVERRLRNGLIITVSGSWQYRQSPDLMHDDLFFLQPCQEFGSCHIISDDSDWDLDDDGAFDVGGQCVVSPEILQECLATGWGREHSLAGSLIAYLIQTLNLIPSQYL